MGGEREGGRVRFSGDAQEVHWEFHRAPLGETSPAAVDDKAETGNMS